MIKRLLLAAVLLFDVPYACCEEPATTLPRMVTGVVRAWEAIPKFQAEMCSATIPSESFANAVAADVTCDDVADVTFLTPTRDAIVVHSFTHNPCKVNETRIALVKPLPTGARLGAADVYGRGCANVFTLVPGEKTITLYNAVDYAAKQETIGLSAPLLPAITKVLSQIVAESKREEILLVANPPDSPLLQASVIRVHDAHLATVRSMPQWYGLLGSISNSIVQVPSGISKPLFRTHTGGHMVTATNDSGMPKFQNLLQEPWTIEWQQPVAGDFNADGRDDLIISGKKINASWIAVSTDSGSIEQAITGIAKTVGPQFAADFNGDDSDDLIGLTADGYLLQNTVQGRVLASALVYSSEGMASLSAEDGSFDLPVFSANTVTVYANLSGVGTQVRPLLANSKALQIRIREDRLLAARPYAAVAFDEVPDGPKVCIGYDPEGISGPKWGRRRICPRGYAVFESDDIYNLHEFAFSCCPLPSREIISDTVEWVKTRRCPEGMVTTGIRDDESNPSIRELGCSPLKNERYRLTKPQAGVYWGLGTAGSSARGGGMERSSLPAAIRDGFGRVLYGNWDQDGCTAAVPGAVLVSSDEPDCADTRFAELEENISNDPARPSWRKLRVVPDCTAIENPFDPLTGCAPEHGL